MPIGGFMGGYLDAGSQLNEQEGQILANKINAFGLEQKQLQASLAAQTRQALQAEMLRQTQAGGNPPAPGAGAPGVAFPDAGAEMGGAPTGTPPGGMGTMGGGKTPDMPLSATLAREYQSNLGLARITAATNPEESIKFKKEADTVLSKIAVAQNEERKEAVEKWQRIKDYAAMPHDQKSMNDMVNLGVAEYGPQFTQHLSTIGFQKDPMSGQYLWDGSRNPEIAKNMGDLALKQIERAKLEQDAAAEKRRADNEKSMEESRQNTARHQAVSEGLQAAALKASIDAKAIAADAREAKVQVKQMDSMTQLSDKYRKESEAFTKTALAPYETASRYMVGPDGKMKAGGFDSSQDLSLRDAYLQAIYPNQRGSTREAKDVAKLPGIPQSIVQGIQNIFLGKDLPPTVRKEMYNAIKEKFVTQNDLQAQREAAAQARLKNIKPEAEDSEVSMYVPSYAIKAKAGIAPPTAGQTDYSNLWSK